MDTQTIEDFMIRNIILTPCLPAIRETWSTQFIHNRSGGIHSCITRVQAHELRVPGHL